MQKKVTLCLEVLNSRVNAEMKGHPDYMCDKVEWGGRGLPADRLGADEDPVRH